MSNIKDEQDAAAHRVFALQKIAELYPDAKTGWGGQIVAPSLLVQDADTVVSTELNGWAAFYLTRKVGDLHVETPTLHCSTVLEWLRANNPEVLETAMRAVLARRNP